jgi:hypothetical protein
MPPNLVNDPVALLALLLVLFGPAAPGVGFLTWRERQRR